MVAHVMLAVRTNNPVLPIDPSFYRDIVLLGTATDGASQISGLTSADNRRDAGARQIVQTVFQLLPLGSGAC